MKEVEFRKDFARCGMPVQHCLRQSRHFARLNKTGKSKRRLMRRAACGLLTVLLPLLAVPMAAFAVSPIDLSRTASLTITEIASNTSQPVPGLELTIYRVAALSDNTGSNFTLTPDFSACGVSVGDLDTAEKQQAASKTVEDYIGLHSVGGIVRKTNSAGTAVFSSLPLGLYLVRVTSTAGTGVTAECETFFALLPMLQGSGWEYDVSAQPKCTLGGSATYQVIKLWEDNSNADNTRPASITVGLYRNGVLTDSRILNASNGWTYAWSGLDAQYTWTAREIAVPPGYTETVKDSGTQTVITNRYKGTASGGVSIPDNNVPLGNFPQTGQNVIRIWACLGLGLALVAFGCFEFLLGRRDQHGEKQHD